MEWTEPSSVVSSLARQDTASQDSQLRQYDKTTISCSSPSPHLLSQYHSDQSRSVTTLFAELRAVNQWREADHYGVEVISR